MAAAPEIYFACSIRGGRTHVAVYEQLVAHLKSRATVLTEIFADNKLTSQGSPGTSTAIYQKDITWIHQAKAVVAEVTNPSLGVGYEIAKAEEWGKPVLALYYDDGSARLSAMIDGSPHVTIARYNDVADAYEAIDSFIASLADI